MHIRTFLTLYRVKVNKNKQKYFIHGKRNMTAVDKTEKVNKDFNFN